MNYNTVWSAIFEPVPTFAFLKRLAKTHGYRGSGTTSRRTSSAPTPAGIVLRTGAAVCKWKPGDRVLVHPNYVALEEPQGHDDAILDPDQRVWGFESNFGGLGELCVARRRPADAEARAPDVGRGGLDAAHELHRLPHARLARTAPTCSRATSC